MKRILSFCLVICILFAFSNFQWINAHAEDPDLYEYAMLQEPTDQELLEDEIYQQLYSSLNENYLIDVQTFYESKEAIEEGLYNSRETEYFGFLLSEVDAEFQGTPYVFCVNDNGETIVREFVPYDDLWGKVLKNVTIGTGVILICITVSSLTVTSAPAVHMVFACAADYAIKYGIRSTAIMGIKSAIEKYVETGDVEESLKHAALGASEGYKYGAIGGSITGAVAKTINLAKLKRLSRMSMNDVATIQKESNFSDATIRNIHSMKEYNVYQKAGLIEYKFGDRTFLLPKDMNWNFVDPATGLTNKQLISLGYNPVDTNGIKYQLHHVGQKTNSPLALLTQDQHQANSRILHTQKVSEVRPMGDNTFWASDKKSALIDLSMLLDIIL